MGHPSVGTEADIAKREEERKKLESLRLSVSHLEPHVLTLSEMETWGYITEIPPGEGGERPSEEGAVQNCERCHEPFQVKRKDEADTCVFHWGRRFSNKQNGVPYMCIYLSLQKLMRVTHRREEKSVDMLLQDRRRTGLFHWTARIL